MKQLEVTKLGTTHSCQHLTFHEGETRQNGQRRAMKGRAGNRGWNGMECGMSAEKSPSSLLCDLSAILSCIVLLYAVKQRQRFNTQ